MADVPVTLSGKSKSAAGLGRRIKKSAKKSFSGANWGCQQPNLEWLCWLCCAGPRRAWSTWALPEARKFSELGTIAPTPAASIAY